MNHFLFRAICIVHFIVFCFAMLKGQEVEIQNYSINDLGQVELEVNSTTNHYYILQIRHDLNEPFHLITSMTMGNPGSTIITEPAGNYPLEHYRVLEYAKDTPEDVDNDGIDDISEFIGIPIDGPLNPAESISADDGFVTIDSFNTFRSLSNEEDYVQWSEFLNGKVYVKYIIVDFNSDQPKTYFINSEKYNLHQDFAEDIGIAFAGDEVKKGQIIFHPSTVAPNGTLGNFAFNYSNGHGQDFEVVRKTYELLAANMPFTSNNLSYFITELNTDEYERDSLLFHASRVPILFEEEVYADFDYWGLNRAEGFGFFRQMSLDEVPGSKDIVLYDALPNSLPRVGGIMTSVMQTPLSHVNLRAIQHNIPNAFIRDPLSIDSIADLLDHYIYFKVEQDAYFIREATQDEVNEWYEDIRPTDDQTPDLNLNYTDILPLESINFDMYDGYGTKCTNVATMRTFGFPDDAIPNGYGVPFYFYQEFMNYHGFFQEIESIINKPDFIADRNVRDERLDDFRKRIRDASMPDWMMDELDDMHQLFPEGTSVRCRSSSNSEDLPGFSGAGLYASKTQHPHEGHISKSIKQVYASMWNLRAFEEREFYRVNHYIASMGVLCHPNFSNENANGVGVSLDPLYNTSNTFYLNSQLGEDLITNPDNTSIPEEILLDRVSYGENDYIILQRSDLIPSDTTILSELHLDQMREYLSVIHDEFAKLYQAKDGDNFAVDIEYKVTSDNRLVIKQARPWASFIPSEEEIPIDPNANPLNIFPNPASEHIVINCEDCNLKSIYIMDITGKIFRNKTISTPNDLNTQIMISSLPSGMYIAIGFTSDNIQYYSAKFIKQ